MFRTGYYSIHNIDISQVVIEQMKKAHKECVWEIMDCTAMSFEESSFSVVCYLIKLNKIFLKS